MMYQAGLTVREISDLCHANVATVHRHVLVRETYEPGFRARHYEARQQREEDVPTTRWKTRLCDLLSFVEMAGRLPRASGDDDERSLNAWLCAQRRLARKGMLSDRKKYLLGPVEGWSLFPSEVEREERWNSRLQAVRDFLRETGRLPRYRNFKDENERLLGVWLHNQFQARTENRMSSARMEKLDSARLKARSRS